MPYIKSEEKRLLTMKSQQPKSVQRFYEVKRKKKLVTMFM